MKKYNVYFWVQHDFPFINLYYEFDRNTLSADDFYERLMEEDNTHGQAECVTFNTLEDAQVYFEKLKSNCKSRVLTSKKFSKNGEVKGIEVEVRCDMCELEVEEYDDEDFISSESVEFYVKGLTI